MQFNSYSYLLLLFVAVLLFWNLPVRFRHGYMLILSFMFYATWNVYFLILPVILCAIVFWSSSKISEGRIRRTTRAVGGNRSYRRDFGRVQVRTFCR